MNAQSRHLSPYLKEVSFILGADTCMNKTSRLFIELKIMGKLPPLPFLVLIASISVLAAGIQRPRDLAALLGFRDHLPSRKFKALCPSDIELL